MYEQELKQYEIIDFIKNVSPEVEPQNYFVSHKLAFGMLDMSKIRGSDYGKNYDIIFFDTFICLDFVVDNDREFIVISKKGDNKNPDFIEGVFSIFEITQILSNIKGNENVFLEDFEKIFFKKKKVGFFKRFFWN
jgi:hypothetical protein